MQELASEGLLVGHKGRGTFVNAAPFATALNILFVHASESPVTYPYTYLLMDGMQQYRNSGQVFRLELMPLAEPFLQSPDDSTIEDMVKHGRIDGVITLPRIRTEQLERLVAQKVPVVQVGGTQFLKPPAGITAIDVGPRRAIDLALEHLRDIGRRNVGLLGTRLTGAAFKKAAVKEAMRSAGLPFKESYFELADWGINGGKDAAEQLLSRCPDIDAIVAADDLQGVGVLQAVAESGRQVPDDIAVVGLGNLLGEHSHSKLTTVDIRIGEQGRRAMQYLHAMVRQQPVESLNLIDPILIRRETT